MVINRLQLDTSSNKEKYAAACGNNVIRPMFAGCLQIKLRYNVFLLLFLVTEEFLVHLNDLLSNSLRPLIFISLLPLVLTFLCMFAFWNTYFERRLKYYEFFCFLLIFFNRQVGSFRYLRCYNIRLISPY